jgi:hypothetical protein
MPPVGFEPTIPVSARQQTYALERAATGIGFSFKFRPNIIASISIFKMTNEE